MTKDDIAQLMSDTSGMIWGDEAHFQRFAKHLIDIEREECAKVCDAINAKHIESYGNYLGDTYAVECAGTIRARGTT